MADEITLTGTFEDIADAIREKGISGTMKATDMPGKIRQIAQIDPEDYYTKSETSSAAELSDAFANVSVDMSGYYQKSETSSAAEISGALGRVEAEALSAISDAGEALQKAEKVQTTLDSDFKLTELSGEYEGGGTFRKFFWAYEPHWFTMKNVGSGNATARLDNVGSTLEYSLDGGSTWTAYVNSSDVTVGAGSEIKFRNNGVDTLTPSYVQAKNSQGSWNVYGNIMTLLDQTGMLKSLAGTQNAFNGMFEHMDVTDASKLELPATTLGTGCYKHMFFGCSASLSAAPELPATILANECYYSMFFNCQALTKVTKELPATTIPDSCYYQMFVGCHLLTKAPYMAATSAPNWSACYAMFKNCSALAEVEVALTQWYTQDNFADWLNGVAAQGVFKCPAALGTNETIARSVHRCPENWTVINV